MFVVLILVLFSPLLVSSFLKHYYSRGHGLPPGNFGWPFFGESFEFIRSNLDGAPEKFILSRLAKHGITSVFTTSLLGEKMAVLCGPTGNKFLFSNEGKKVALWWPASVRGLLGPSLITKAGEEARVEKKVFAGFFSPDTLMRYVATMDVVTREHFRSRWEDIFLLSLYAFFTTKPDHNLPPGTLGWPAIGENVEYMQARRVEGSTTRFFLDKTCRYGWSVFKALIFGEKIVFLSGQAGNKFLFSNEGKKVAMLWPTSVRRLVETSLVTKVGEEAKSRRKMLMNFFNIDNLSSYVGIMDELTKRQLNLHWRGKEKLETYPTMKLYTFELACRLFMSITDPQLVSELAVHFNVFLKGVISLPINFPGAKFYRARKAADAIKKELCTLLNQRRKELEEKTVLPSQDLLSHLLSDENGKFMPEIEILNNMLNLLFAGHDTSSSALTLVIKYLAELPNVREKVLAEQKEIAASKRPGESLGWDDIQKMRYSWNVISEVMRLNPPVIGSFREALFDITYEGYTIPKGWKLYWSAAVTHRDPNLHQAPASFDESRFEGSGPPPFSYVPFGGGPRMCLGKEFARLEMLVFLHNLVNNFEWNLVNPGERIVYDPMPTPVDGLPIRIRPLIIEA